MVTRSTEDESFFSVFGSKRLTVFLRIMLLGLQGFFASISLAQDNTGGIRGAVTDKEFDVPLGDASVWISGTDARTKTDETGHFAVYNLSPDAYTVIIEKDGFERVVKSDVVVTSGSMTSLSVSLPGEYVDMQEIVVRPLTLDRSSDFMSEFTTDFDSALALALTSEIELMNLRAEEVGIMNAIGSEFMSKAGAGTAAEAMKLVSGATVANDKYAVIRGLSDRFVNTRVNGIAMPTADPDVRAVQLDLFPSALLDSVRVYKTFTPDLPGDTSGGSVDIVTRRIPAGLVLEFKSGVSYNSQATGNDKFLVSPEGVDYFGTDEGDRKQVLQNGEVPDVDTDPRGGFFQDLSPEEEAKARLLDRQTRQLSPHFGVTRDSAPVNHSWGLTYGDRLEFGDKTAVGWLMTGTYKNSFSYDDSGTDRFLVGGGVDPESRKNLRVDEGFGIPEESGESPNDLDPDQWKVEAGKEKVRWGVGGLLGFEHGEYSLSLSYLRTQNTEDEASLRFDDETNSASIWVDQSLIYTERTLESLQLRGSMPLAFIPEGYMLGIDWKKPKVDGAIARNEATQNQPDRRFFLGNFNPNIGVWGPPRVPKNFAERSWREIEEENDYLHVDLTWPFAVGVDEREGEIKGGVSINETTRSYEQDTFIYESPNIAGSISPFRNSPAGSFTELWTDVFLESERLGYPPPIGAGVEFSDLVDNEVNWVIQPFTDDVDYKGTMDISAQFVMAEVPVLSWLTLVGGMRWEKTEISTRMSASDGDDDDVRVLNVRARPDRPQFQTAGDQSEFALDIFGGTEEEVKSNVSNLSVEEILDELPVGTPPEQAAFFKETLADDGKVTLGELADTDIDQTDILPAVGIIIEPFANTTNPFAKVKLRANWSQTIARPTFKEISPVAQQDHLNGQRFAGNPNLQISQLDNYDLRLEWIPGIHGMLYSVSAFYKDIDDPIDNAQRPAGGSQPFVIPFNFESGEVKGLEFEIRQDLDPIADWLEDLDFELYMDFGRLGDWSAFYFGRWIHFLDGFSFGLNYTVLEATIEVPQRDQERIAQVINSSDGDSSPGTGLDPNDFDLDERPMKDQPEYLLNLFLLYDLEKTGTSFGIFFNRSGDTLLAGEDANGADYIGNRIAKPFNTLDISLSQKFWQNWKFSFKVENILNPEIEEVWRSEFVPGEPVASSSKKGVTYSFSLGAKW